VKHGLTDTPNLPDSIAALRQQYFKKVDRSETTYHLALDGSRAMIREREKLSQELVVLLDQIASILEAAFILNPDALLTTGFTVTQERRSTNRVKLPLVAPLDFNVANAGEQGRALATASTFRGALVMRFTLTRKTRRLRMTGSTRRSFPIPTLYLFPFPSSDPFPPSLNCISRASTLSMLND